jgi:predicted SAM-dependent methyltransferase
MKKLLHVGCGTAKLEKLPKGFNDGNWQEVRFDIDDSPAIAADILGTITDMNNVEDASVDALYSSHNIEHVYYHQVLDVLKEFKRVTKPNGFCVITCPDMQTIAKFMAEGKFDEPLYHSPSGPISPLDIAYGHIKSIEHGHEYMAHKMGLSHKLLGDFLQKAGFAKYLTKRRAHKYDLWAVAFNYDLEYPEAREIFEAYTGVSLS